MKRVIQYLKDVRAEMAKVNWPNKKEVSGASVLVVVFSIVMALFVFACDQGLQAVIGMFLMAR